MPINNDLKTDISQLREEDLLGRCFRFGVGGEPLFILGASVEDDQLVLMVRKESGGVARHRIAWDPAFLSMAQLSMDQFFEPVDCCPLCQKTTAHSRVRFQANQLFWDIPVVECLNCGLLYKSYSPTVFLHERIYSREYSHFNTSDDADTAIRILESRVSRLGCPRGRHLDYGCGAGYFVEAALAAGWDSFGCDPFLPDRLLRPPKNERFFKIDATQGDALAGLGTFDCISLWAVLEHMPNLGRALGTLAGMLRPGGTMVFNSPNGRSLVARKAGRSWILSTLVEHVAFMSPQSVRWFAHEHDLVIKKLRISGSPYPFSKGGRGLLEQGLHESLFQCVVLPAVPEVPAEPVPVNRRSLISPLVHDLSSLALNRGEQGWLATLLRSVIHLTRIGDHIDVRLVKPV